MKEIQGESKKDDDNDNGDNYGNNNGDNYDEIWSQ